MARCQGGCGDRLAPVRISHRCRQQFQFRDGRVGKTLPDPLLLGDDDVGGGLADRQPSAEPVGFDVVVDEYGTAVFVVVEAVQREVEDVFGAAAGVDADLGGNPDLGRFEGVEMGAQHGHDLGRQAASGFAAFGIGGNIDVFDGEVAGQSGGVLTGPGQSQGSDSGQHLAHVAADHVALVAADPAGGFQVAEPVEEPFQVGAPKGGWIQAVVGSASEVFGQPPEVVDFAANSRGTTASVVWQLFGGPPLGRVGQPRLGDRGERQIPRDGRRSPDPKCLWPVRCQDR